MVVVIHHTTPLRLGAGAVFVFFVLSGYWISRMWEERYVHTRKAPLTFLVSRWWRLAPVYISCLGLAALVSGMGLFPPVTAPLPSNVFVWMAQQLPIVGSTAAGRFFPPAWSLDVEMQFYLLSALLLPFVIRGRNAPQHPAACWSVVALLLSLTLAFLFRGGSPEQASILPWLGFFAAGVAIHRTNFRPSRLMAFFSAGTVVLLAAVALLHPETSAVLWRRGAEGHVLPILYNWRDHLPVGVLFAGAVALIPYVAWNISQRSSSRDRLLGNWAYPLYLFHWIPRDWYYSVVDWSAPSVMNVGLWLLNIVAALIGSFLILVMIDRPTDRWRARWVNKRVMGSVPNLVASPVSAISRSASLAR